MAKHKRRRQRRHNWGSDRRVPPQRRCRQPQNRHSETGPATPTHDRTGAPKGTLPNRVTWRPFSYATQRVTEGTPMTAPDELRERLGRHLAKARTPRDRIGLIGSVGLSVALIVWIATSLLADPSDRRLREMPSPPEAKKMKDSKREAKSPPPEPRGLAILVLPAPPPEVSPSAVAFPAPTAEPGSGPQAESMTPPKQPPRPLPRPALTASQTTGQERAQALAARFEPLRPARCRLRPDKNRPPLKPMLNPNSQNDAGVSNAASSHQTIEAGTGS